jgi:hypothetical protein
MPALEPEIDQFVMAITSAEATVRQLAPAKLGEQGKQAAMAKKNRHSRVEIATKLAPANALATQGKLQSEIANRTLGEGDKFAQLELENSQLRQLVTDLLGWDEREIQQYEKRVNAPKKLPRRGGQS